MKEKTIERKIIALNNKLAEVRLEYKDEMKNYKENKTIEFEPFYYPSKIIVCFSLLFIIFLSFNLTPGYFVTASIAFLSLFMAFYGIFAIDTKISNSKFGRMIKLYHMKKNKRYKSYILAANRDYNEIIKKVRNLEKQQDLIIRELRTISEDSKNEEKFTDLALDLILTNKAPLIEKELIESLVISKEVKKELIHTVEQKNYINN